MGKFTVTGPDGKAYDVTAPDGATEEEIIAYVQNQIGASTSSEPEERGTGRGLGDFAVGVAGAVPKAAGAIVSLGSLVPGVNVVADPIAESLMDAGQRIDKQFLSEYQQSINQDMAQAIAKSAKELGEDASIADHIANISSQGGAAAAFVYDNPSQAIMLAGQAIPYLFGGGVLTKGVQSTVKGVQVARGTAASRATATGLGAATAGAAGEGLMAGGVVAGDIVGQLRDQGVTDYTTDRLAAIPAGIATSLIGRASAGLNRGLDADTAIGKMFTKAPVVSEATDLVAATAKKPRGLIRRTLTGGAFEAGEEFLQSGQEQAFTNLGTGKGISEDVGSSAVLGAAAGFGMGSVIGAFNKDNTTPVVDIDAVLDEKKQIEQDNAEVAAIEISDKQLAADQRLIRTDAAKTFRPYAQFRKERLAALEAKTEADADNPSTELGKAIDQAYAEARAYDPAARAAVRAAALKKYKANAKPDEDMLLREYEVALDNHAGQLALARQLSPQLENIAPVVAEPTKAGAKKNPFASKGKAEVEARVAAKPKKITQREADEAYAAELGIDWRTDAPASVLHDGKKFTPRGKTNKSQFRRRIDEIVAENQAEKEASESSREITSAVQGFEYANDRLGKGWEETNPKLGNMLTDGAYEDFEVAVEKLFASKGATETVASMAKGIAKPTGLSKNQAKVWDVLNQYFLGDKQSEIDEVYAGKPGEEKLQQGRIAKLAGVKNIGATFERFRTKLLEDADALKKLANETDKDAAISQFVTNLKTANSAKIEENSAVSSVAPGISDDVDTDTSDTKPADNERTLGTDQDLAVGDGNADPNSAVNIGEPNDDEQSGGPRTTEDGAKDFNSGMSTRSNKRAGLEAADAATKKEVLATLRSELIEEGKNEGLTPKEFNAAVRTAASSDKFKKRVREAIEARDKDVADSIEDDDAVEVARRAEQDSVAARQRTAVEDREVISRMEKSLRGTWDSRVPDSVSAYDFLTEQSKIDFMYAVRLFFNQNQGAVKDYTSIESAIADITKVPDYAVKPPSDTKPKPPESAAPDSFTVPKKREREILVETKPRKRTLKRKTNEKTKDAQPRGTAEVQQPVRQDDTAETEAAESRGPNADTTSRETIGNTGQQAPTQGFKGELNSAADAPNVLTSTQNKSNPRNALVRQFDDAFVSEVTDPMYLGFSTVDEALDHIERTGNNFEKRLAKRIKELVPLGNYSFKIVDPNNPRDTLAVKDFKPVEPRATARQRSSIAQKDFRDVVNIWNEDRPPLGLATHLGSVDSETASSIIMLHAGKGLTNNTFLHEMLHGVTFQTIAKVQNGIVTSGPEFDLVEDLNDLMMAVNRTSKQTKATQLMSDMNISLDEAIDMKSITEDFVDTSIHEFVSYAFTDPSFQAYLDTLVIATDGKVSAWAGFVNAIRKFMNMKTGVSSVADETALTRVLSLTDSLLDARTAAQSSRAQQRRGLLPNQNVKITAQQQKTVRSDAKKVRDKIGDNLGTAAKRFYDDASFVAETGTGSLKFLHQFMEDNADKIPAIGKWYRAMLEAEAVRNEIRMMYETIAVRARNLDDDRLAVVNDFIGRSTFYQKWGYDPEIKDKPVKVDPIMARGFARLTDNEKSLVMDVFAHGEKMKQRKIEVAKKLGVSGSFFTDAALEGPYAPLKRFGNFAGELKSQRLLDAEKALADKDAAGPNILGDKDTKNERAKVDELKSNPDHYMISFFDTMGAARQFRDENGAGNGGRFVFAEASERAPDVAGDRIGNPEVYEKVIGALKAGDSANMDPAAKKAFQDMVQGLYIQSLDERSARLAGTRRMNRAGYDKNMMRSFLSHARAEASLLAQMETGTDVNTAFAEAKVESAKGGEEARSTYAMVVRHYRDTLDQKETPFQDRIAAVNSVYMLTSSVGYHVTNATQPIMVTVPRIAGDMKDYTGTWSALFKGYNIAYKIVQGSFAKQLLTAPTLGLLADNQVSIDIQKAPPEYRKLLEYLQLHQLLDVGMEEDLGEFNRFDTGYASLNTASDFVGKATHRMYQTARFVEAYNRVSSAIAAYDMAQKNPATIRRMKMTPLEYATSVVQDTQGNFSRLDAPLALKMLPKVMVQYRKYQLLMGWHYAKAFKATLPESKTGMSVHERAAGKRVLRYSLAHAFLGAGVTGMPLVSSIFWLTTFLGDEDEPDDLERWIDRNVEDKRLAGVLARGLPASLGLDLSTKLDQSKLHKIFPYLEVEAGADGAKDVFFQFAGPAGTTASNFFRAAKYFESGDLFKGAEYMVPKGLRSAAESFRLATEGYSLTNRDVVVDPREMGTVSLLLNSMGLPSSEINKIKWTRGQQYELKEYFDKQSGKIRNQYIEADRNRNRDKQADLRRQWRELQQSKERVRPFFNNTRGVLERQSIVDLYRAPRRAEKRQDKNRQILTGN